MPLIAFGHINSLNVQNFVFVFTFFRNQLPLQLNMQTSRTGKGNVLVKNFTFEAMLSELFFLGLM